MLDLTKDKQIPERDVLLQTHVLFDSSRQEGATATVLLVRTL